MLKNLSLSVKTSSEAPSLFYSMPGAHVVRGRDSIKQTGRSPEHKLSSATVRLGLMPPLTGVVGIYGKEIIHAAQIACNEINQNGGVLGRPLEIIVEDDGSLPASSVVAANKLVEEHKCVALIGNLLSNSRIAVAYSVAEPQRIPYLNFSFYEGSILSKYFFHFAALPNHQIDRMIPFMKNRFGPKFFFAGNNYEWPRGSIDAAKKVLNSIGGTTLGEEYFQINPDESELDQMLDRLKKSGANVFVPYFAGMDQINILKMLNKKNLKGKIAVVMGHYDEIMASMLTPEMREGFYSSNTYFMSVKTQKNSFVLKNLELLEDVEGIWPNGNGIITNFGEGTYTCVKAFALAANLAGSLDAEKLVTQLETISVEAPQGMVTMDKDTHHATVNNYLARSLSDGTFKIVERFESISPVIPDRYRHMTIRPRSTLEAEIRLQARILSQMSEGVSLVRVDDGCIIYTTDGLDKLFASGTNNYIGKHITSLYAKLESSSSSSTQDLNDILYKKGHWKEEVQCRRADGSLFWCEVITHAFTHAEFGEVLMSVYRDVSERKTKDLLLEEAKNNAEMANKYKTEFLAYMSHEFKTPLSSIIGHTQLLIRSAKKYHDDQYIRGLEIIEKSCLHILSLIKDVIDISFIESGKLTVNESIFELNDILKEVIDEIEPLAKKNNNILICNVGKSIGEMHSDATKLKQILLNLLSNACKFTSDGTITLNVFEMLQSKESDLIFEVIDTGTGISSGDAERIFTPFTKMISDRNIPGSGLGLTISKKYVEHLGGQINFESELNKGSKFSVKLPRQISLKHNTDLYHERAP